MSVFKEVESSINKLINNIDSINIDRKKLLTQFAEYISNTSKKEKEVNLTFICTHNSRRSHMSQIWAQTAAEHYDVPNINCYSGGTEATAFNLRAVKAVEDAGFKIEKKDESDNPLYLVYYSDDKEPLKCFSKVYGDPFNPQKDFAAVMTCSDADENCPVVFGADVRFPIRYNDPKEYDDTKLEEEMYMERCNQIGSEMIYAFNLLKSGAG